MGKYGEAALNAVKLFYTGNFITPNEAWTKSVREIFPNSKSSQNKVCPKNAFLGLCSEGLIKNISKGNYTDSEKNKSYAILAINILKKNDQIKTPKDLWYVVTKGVIKHNMQMDVVLSLWNNGYIII